MLLQIQTNVNQPAGDNVPDKWVVTGTYNLAIDSQLQAFLGEYGASLINKQRVRVCRVIGQSNPQEAQ